MNNTCPICFYTALFDPPYDVNGYGSDEICPCCGFHFGYDDFPDKESVLSVYHTIYMPYIGDYEQMAISEDSQVVDIGTSFIFRILFLMSNIHDFSHIRFDGIMLSGINFGKLNFQNSSFRGCLLIGCNFDGCDLRGADFSSASLQNADFRNAIIDDTTIFSILLLSSIP